MGEYVGVDLAGNRWVVVSIADDSIEIGTQPSIRAVWDQHGGANLILVDIPIDLPDNPDSTPRSCDEEAGEVVTGSRYSTIFDVPCRTAVQTSDHQTVLQRNIDKIEDESLGAQKWGFAELIHEVDVFMRGTDTARTGQESHTEVCFAVPSPGRLTGSKKTDTGQSARLDFLRTQDERRAKEYEAVCDRIETMPAWKRRIGLGMMDDVMDAMVLDYTASLKAEDGLTALGSGRDAEGLPMEIVRPKGSSVWPSWIPTRTKVADPS